MSPKRTRLALSVLASLGLAACSGKQPPILTAQSAEPHGTASRQVGSSMGGEEAPSDGRESRPEPFSYARPETGGDGPSAPPPPVADATDGGGLEHGRAHEEPSAAREPSAADAMEDAPPLRDDREYGSAKGRPSKSEQGRSSSAYRPEPRPEFRPGLATQWGEARDSHVTSATFYRANEAQPFSIGKLFYNEQQGLESMRGGRYASSRSMFPVGPGYLEVGLRGDDGRFITGFSAGGDNFVPGIAGHRYSIVVKNQSPGRIEVVASVDGLDVVDGRPAAYAKRGYLLDAWGQVEIEGFRTSTSEVASFRFGSVGQSYAAQKHGETRNVGVIGIAAFHERGDDPWRWSQPRYPDTQRRLDADPFPMRFSTPPR
jgi:hypothetical protein